MEVVFSFMVLHRDGFDTISSNRIFTLLLHFRTRLTMTSLTHGWFQLGAIVMLYLKHMGRYFLP
jgi:hypothetical protein